MYPVHEVLRTWEERAQTASLLQDNRAAHLLRLCTNELKEALREVDNEVLTLTQAAQDSGYTVDHLRRLVSGGKIPNAGRKHAPRIRRADLPKKAGRELTTDTPVLQLDRTPTQIARLIAAEGR